MMTNTPEHRFKWWKVASLIAVGLAQFAVPGYMIRHQEGILHDGKEYKFKTAPVDPYDMFRGRYVRLNLDSARIKQDGRGYQRGETVYALLATAPDGFTRIVGASRTRPHDGEYFAARVRYGWQQELTLELPFDRYYLKENHAPEAEKLYRMSTQRKSAWITVRIKDGEAALDELYIDGKPVGQQLNGSSGK